MKNKFYHIPGQVHEDPRRQATVGVATILNQVARELGPIFGGEAVLNGLLSVYLYSVIEQGATIEVWRAALLQAAEDLTTPEKILPRAGGTA